MIRDISLTWYMKYKAIVPAGRPRSLAKIKNDILKEFKKPKSKSQCITKIKEIKQKEGEVIWDYEKWFKILLDRLAFLIQVVKHRELFILGLLRHIQVSITQKKVMNQAEAVEIMIRLEATLGGAETLTGLVQVQSQLANLTIQLQDMDKTKFMCDYIWCTTCHSEGNH